jgi:hypothetical protein
VKVSDYTLLADRYDFSGGEIDNIIRKIEISDILYHQSIDIETTIQILLGRNNEKKMEW